MKHADVMLGLTKKCFLPLAVLGVIVGCLAAESEPVVPAKPAARPASWATPLAVAGVPNLNRVSDHLYRSAQPTAEGMKQLKTMGVKTIVNLRSFHSDRDEIGATKLAYEHLYMKAWHPEYKEAVDFLKIVTDPKRTPVLVHCQHGSDRTGTLCAIYRIAVQGWSKQDAIREMHEGGYGFHEVFSNLPKWIDDLDIERLRKDAGIKVESNKEVGPNGR